MRFSWTSALAGAAGLMIIVLAGSWIVIETGHAPANADTKPPGFEKYWAMRALHKTVDRLAPKGDAPIPASDANLTEGAKLYQANCSVCHGASDGRPTTIAAGLYQKPPMFAKHGVDDDPVGETFWKIEHGIRFTGMPAYSKTLSEEEGWKIALFLKHLPQLPSHAETEWKSMKAPGQLTSAPRDIQHSLESHSAD